MSANESEIWPTAFEPMPDVTAWELALDHRYVNASEMVSSRNAAELGTALRHRVLKGDGRRMDVIWAIHQGLPVPVPNGREPRHRLLGSLRDAVITSGMSYREALLVLDRFRDEVAEAAEQPR